MLTGPQIAHLLDAYPCHDNLRMMVRVELGENLDLPPFRSNDLGQVEIGVKLVQYRLHLGTQLGNIILRRNPHNRPVYTEIRVDSYIPKCNDVRPIDG